MKTDSHTILVIEDNTEVRENTSEILELAGYKTLLAKNGKEGLLLAHKHIPDLILCDIMMPELDGFGVLRALENIPELLAVPFVFMTAKAEKEDFRAGMDLGADDYIGKPFSGDELLRIVSSRLNKSLRLREKYDNNLDGLNTFMNDAKTEQGLKLLADHRTLKKLKKKEQVYLEGDSPNFLYFIVSGKIKIFKSNESGKEYIIDILKTGDFLGYSTLMEEGVYKESATAIEDSTVALIPKQEFFQLLFSNRQIALKFIKLMSNNYSETEDKLIRLAYDSARKRVAEALLFVSKKYNDPKNSDIPFTLNRDNISSLSGISPESVSRNLSSFKDEGLIETSNGRIKILNRKKLETLKN